MPRTHEKVSDAPSSPCLGPGGSVWRVRETMRMLGGRWKLDILFRLFGTPTLRFSELEKSIPGVSQKMLASRLRELEKDGIVKRVVHPEVPPRVDYSLTESGEALKPLLRGMRDWRI